MLAPMVQRVLQTHTLEDAIQTILDDVIAMHGAEYGNVQLPSGEELVIVAQRGLSDEFLKTFRRKEDGSACGRALRLGQQVIIEDVETDPEFSQFRPEAHRAGFRSVQSQPFISGSGMFMAIVSTHFANTHTPTLLERETLKKYSVVAADRLFGLLEGDNLGSRAEQMTKALYGSRGL